MKRTLLLLTLVVAMVCSSLSLHAQNDVGLTITFRNEPLVSVFQRLEGATPYKFLFNYDEVSKYNVTLSVNNASALEVLRQAWPTPTWASRLTASSSISSGTPIPPRSQTPASICRPWAVT